MLYHFNTMALAKVSGTGMSKEQAVLSTAFRFLTELKKGDMEYALDEGLLLLRLMAVEPDGLDNTTIVLPTPPPRKANKSQVAPYAR
jgi:hypothetical protein